MKYKIFLLVFFISFYTIGCGSTNNETYTENNIIEDNNSVEDNQTMEENNVTIYPSRGIIPLDIDFQSTTAQNNKAAYVTSQCYTKTVDDNEEVHNPCFSCHINSNVPNYIDDADIQESYDFGEYTKINRFTNLFKDRTDLVGQVSDAEINDYINTDNYIKNGEIILTKKLQTLPREWDNNDNGTWEGYMPDCYFNFDSEGFDKDSKGTYTGWRAFAYYPFLGTFWPTNGSTDDVLIRLPEAFRVDEKGNFNKEIYHLNLSIIEALIKQKDIAITATDEKKYGVDLNQNGTLDTATQIVFNWIKPTYDVKTGKIGNFSMQYVGYANTLLIENTYLIAPGLYPKDTEFLHSVRYIGMDEKNSTITMAPRMKELRYARKMAWVSYAALSNAMLSEIKEKDTFPDRLRTI